LRIRQAASRLTSETPVGVVDEFLFGGNIGVLLRHGSYTDSIGADQSNFHPPEGRL
jgi:hypothetical protein